MRRASAPGVSSGAAGARCSCAGGDGDIEGAAFHLEIGALEFARKGRGDGACAELVVVLIERREDPRDR